MSKFDTAVIKGVTYMEIGQVHGWETYVEKHFYERNETTCHKLLEYLNGREKHSVYEEYLVKDRALYYPPSSGLMGSIFGGGHKYRINWKMQNISILIERIK